MELAANPMAWAILGTLLVVAELIIPGGIVVLIGASALVVAASLKLSFINTGVHALTFWFIGSTVLLISFRNLAQKMVGGDRRIENTDEELDLYGEIAEVTQTIGPGHDKGRVEYQGSGWTALGDGSVIEVGAKVRIISRDNISLVVEKEQDELTMNNRS